jgi:GNAT superfamily N-acetyltransferase
MRPAKGVHTHYWVARRDEIIGALNLSVVEDGYWLTGLFVDPAERGQGIAGVLIRSSITDANRPVWLFCNPTLAAFYKAYGFYMNPDLPEPLKDRLKRYQQNKSLIALAYRPESGHP